jgi:competence protein ComEA
MKEQEKKPARFDDIIDRYRWYIGAFLLFLVIISGGYLLWRERGREVAGKHQVAGLEELNNKIRSMEAKTLQLEEKIISLGKKQSVAETADVSAEQGVVAGASISNQTSTNSKQEVISGKININTATIAQLDTLPGIGPAYANRIIEYRNSNGGFKDISEVQNIKGIGPKTFEKIKDKISI